MSEKTRKTGFNASALGLIALLVIGLLAGGSSETPAESTTNKGGKGGVASQAPLEEVGPGQCVPARSILANLRKQRPGGENFRAPYSRVELKVQSDHWIGWVARNLSKPCVKAMAKSVSVKPADFPRYLRSKVELKELKAPLTVLNSYFHRKDGHIVKWKVQTFPVGELIWFDHLGNPVFKYICGNRLFPERPRKDQPKPTPSPSPTCPHKEFAPGVCNPVGKDAGDKPDPAGGDVVKCPGGYLGRDGICHTGTNTPSPQPTPSQGAGQGDSGPGATNTTPPPPTTQPEDPNPSPSSPSSNPPKP